MQVLMGLQSNALKFTEKGKVEILAEILSDDKMNGEYLQISVIDTGAGIPYKD